MADLDFMGYKRVILKSDQEPRIVPLCDTVKNGCARIISQVREQA